MNKVINTIYLILFILTFYRNGNCGTLEKYTSHTIIHEKMGTGINNFGIFSPSPNEPEEFVGPNAITVDDKNNIYILDPINHRIKIYSEKGEYLSSVLLSNIVEGFNFSNSCLSQIAVDRYENIFITATKREYGNALVIIKINKNGDLINQFISYAQLIKTYGNDSLKNMKLINNIKKSATTHVLPENEGAIRNIYKDLEGYVYLKTSQNDEINLSSNNLEKRNANGFFIKGRKNIIKREPEIINYSKLLPIKKMIVVNARDSIFVQGMNIDLPNDILKKGWSLFHASIKAEDEKGNIYVSIVGDKKGDNGNIKLTSSEFDLIYKYSPYFNKIGIVYLPIVNENTYVPLAFSKKGSIYQLVINPNNVEDGVKVIKWKFLK